MPVRLPAYLIISEMWAQLLRTHKIEIPPPKKTELNLFPLLHNSPATYSLVKAWDSVSLRNPLEGSEEGHCGSGMVCLLRVPMLHLIPCGDTWRQRNFIYTAEWKVLRTVQDLPSQGSKAVTMGWWRCQRCEMSQTQLLTALCPVWWCVLADHMHTPLSVTVSSSKPS